ncbi:MAG: VTT domain-containing protein [Nitrososphaerota archaeon]|nr:VTT domain-containing protein [Candidatus Calditenuaceae archaeon]MDW8073112.1 VTT domain-containing protein [Nitrososphaerota archaeon]
MNLFDPEFWTSLTTLGYTGVFAASLLGSLLPFVSGPYIPPILLGIIGGRLDPLPTALLSAAGAASGKFILFNLFRGGRRLLSRESLDRIAPLEKVIRRYGWVVVLLTAATPVPDDIVYVLLAVGGYRNAYFFPIVFAGKLFITTVVSFAALYWMELACLLVECGPTGLQAEVAILFAVASAGAAMLLVYVITRLDWQRILLRLGVSE